MAQIRISAGLHKAQAVLSIMQTMVFEDASDSSDILVAGYEHGSGSGLSFSCVAQDRKCLVIGDPKTEGLTVVTGKISDFNYPDGTPKDSAICHPFGQKKYFAAAHFATIWLNYGLRTTEAPPNGSKE
jgi:hypothetical protein